MAQKDNAGTGRITLFTRLEQPVGGGDVNYYYVNFLGNKHNRSTAGAFKWQHIAIVCNPSDQTVTFYVNGERDSTVPANVFEACSGGFRIGGHKANKDYWHGMIDELYFFKGILTPDEICKVRDNEYISSGSVNVAGAASAGISYDAGTRIVKISDGSNAKSIKVYGVSGQELKCVNDKNSLQLANLDNGVYIVKAVDANGVELSAKVSVR